MGFEEIGSNQRGEDAAFLYVLCIFQFLALMFGIYKLYLQLFNSSELKKEYKLTYRKMVVAMTLMLLNGLWCYKTLELINLEAKLKT